MHHLLKRFDLLRTLPNITDEFIEPTIIGEADPNLLIREGDAVIFFNFRTDRPRQLTEVLSQKAYQEYNMHPLKLDFVTMTEYDASFLGIPVLFKTDNLNNTLGEVISHHGLSQLRVAETEKYPHVTFFFSGGRETPFAQEDRILIPSAKVATYDLKPEMSANEITAAVLEYWKTNAPDFICLNYANTDMVGHTGVFKAGILAAETVDQCLERLITSGLEKNYSFLILADHGNADCMINPDGSPNTAHTKNPVPLIYIGKESLQLKEGKLGDIAPTILKLMGVEIPSEMSGDVLFNNTDKSK
jgi:2,3-bisphosphoglycerate-independent phosphoglycerate mutase